MSAHEVAQAAHCSPATVVRFAQALDVLGRKQAALVEAGLGDHVDPRVAEAALGAGLVLFGLVARDASAARAFAVAAHLLNTDMAAYHHWRLYGMAADRQTVREACSDLAA